MEPMAWQRRRSDWFYGERCFFGCYVEQAQNLCTTTLSNCSQVTNPPIDPIREDGNVLVSFIGLKPNLLDTNNINPPMRLEVSQPILNFDDIAKLRNISANTGGKFKSYELDICYPVAWGKDGIEARLASICAEVVDAVKSGHNIMIITDRKMDADHVAIPALLATSTVHQHLVSKGLRTTTGFGRGNRLCVRLTISLCSRATAQKRYPYFGDGNAGSHGQ